MYRLLTLLIITLAAFNSAAQAQTYIVTESTGNVPFMYDLRYYLEMKFDGPADDVLSAWQPMPFDWEFYGQKVDGYFISDNGYITFDKNATQSVSENIAIPDHTAPNDAIFAFWDALHLDDDPSQWSNCVQTATIGEAPNRKHVIYWIGVAPEGYSGSSSNTLSFCVVLNEGGGFDIIFVAGAHRPQMSGTIGTQHALGGVFGTMVAGPDKDFPNVNSDGNDDITYSFVYSDSQLDGAAHESLLPLTAKAGTNVSVKFVFQNTGMNTITGFDAHYVGTSEVLYTKQVRDISLPSNGKYTVTFDDPWTAQNPGAFTDITMWIDNVDDGLDGTFDTNQMNDTLVAAVWVQLGVSAPRRILMEEFTGAWCGWCPDGAVKMQEIEGQYGDDVALVAIHAGGNDNMITSEGQGIADALANGFPSGLVDRVQFPGEDRHALVQRSKWIPAINLRINEGSPVALTANSTYEAGSRDAVVRAYMDFKDYPYPADYRLNVWLVEDRVQGDGPGWDQRNYFAGNSSYPNHPFYGLPDPVPDYVHMHVLRKSATGTWGQPVGPMHFAGNLEWHEFNMTLEKDWKAADMKVLVFLSEYNPKDGVYDVVNAFETPLGTVNPVEKFAPSTMGLSPVAPNPVNDVGRLTLALGEMHDVQVALYSQLGQELRILKAGLLTPGTHTIAVDARGLQPGTYFVVATGDGIREVRPVVIVR